MAPTVWSPTFLSTFTLNSRQLEVLTWGEAWGSVCTWCYTQKPLATQKKNYIFRRKWETKVQGGHVLEEKRKILLGTWLILFGGQNNWHCTPLRLFPNLQLPYFEDSPSIRPQGHVSFPRVNYLHCSWYRSIKNNNHVRRNYIQARVCQHCTGKLTFVSKPMIAESLSLTFIFNSFWD